MKYRFSVIVLLSLLLTGLGAAYSPDIVSDMVTSGQAFLGSLQTDQRQAATFSLADDERFDWHYIPRDRNGVPLKDLTPAQRKLAHAFLASGLSPEGVLKANQIMFLEEILYQIEGNRLRRDPDGYYFSVFGEPSKKRAWGWRVEGHHLSLNFTAQEGEVISSTPSFWGANPAEVKEGPNKGLQVLAAEELLARELVRAFQGAKREQVMISHEAPADILTRASAMAEMGPPEGVAIEEMSRSQAEMLNRLIELYAHRLRRELAETELEKLREAGWDRIHFAWAGGTEPGQPHYYRIQGPTFVIEYDNTQNNANHIHTVWRNFKNDFGRDLLKEHYLKSHSH